MKIENHRSFQMSPKAHKVSVNPLEKICHDERKSQIIVLTMILDDSRSTILSIMIRLEFKRNHHLPNDLEIADEIHDEL